MSRLDVTTLVAGVGIAAAGAVLLLDQSGALDLSLAWAAPLVLGLIGAILLAAGLEGPRRRG